MAQRRNELQLGVLTLVVIGLAVAILISVKKEVVAGDKQVAIRFDPSPFMPPINEGAIVLVGGQTVGKVTTAKLQREAAATDEAQPSFHINVVANIRDDLVLRENCSAFAEAPALGGAAIIRLDLGTAEDVFDGAYIDGSPPDGFAGALASIQTELDGTREGSLLWQIKTQLDPEAEKSMVALLNKSLADVNTITESLSMQLTREEKDTLITKIKVVADNVAAMTTNLRNEFDRDQPEVMLAKLHATLDTLNVGIESMSRLVSNNEDALNRTITNVETTTNNIARETDGTKADSLVAQIRTGIDKLNTSLDDFNVITDTTRGIVVLNRQNINRLLINFKESSDHIKTGVKYVLRHPWRLLNAPDAKEMKEQAIFDAARSFAEAATSVDDAAARLQSLAELHNGSIPIEDPDLQVLRDDLKTTQTKYRQAEAKLWSEIGGG